METYEHSFEPLPAEQAQPEGRDGVRLLLALAVFIAAYLFVSLVPIRYAPLGFLLLTVCFYAATAVFALLRGGRLRAASVLAMVFGIGVAGYHFFRGGPNTGFFDLFPVFCISGLTYAYFVLTLFDSHSRMFGSRFLLDICKGIAFHFVSFGSIFRDVFKSGPKDKKRTSVVLGVIFGLVFAAVLLLIVGSLLSYDEHFTAMLPEFDIDDIAEIFGKLVLSVPISAVIYSIFDSSSMNKLPGVSSEASRSAISGAVSFVPALLITLPVAAVLVMYVMFFISQWAYYMSAFTHTLPSGYSAAEFAREGFFQLLVVACINAALIIGMRCFMKRVSKAAQTAGDVLSVMLSAATIVLIITAMSKLLLYIDLYDLTRDRLIAAIFLVFLALAFVFVILSVVIKKVKALPCILAAALILVFAYSVVNTDRMIAEYNVDSYLSGRHANIDVSYLADELELNATEQLIRLRDNAKDAKVVSEASEAIRKHGNSVDSDPTRWYRLSMPILNARRAIESAGK